MIGLILCSLSLFFGIVPTGDWEVRRPGDVSTDKSISSYALRQKPRVDLFDFSGDYDNLQNIDIDGARLKSIQVLLTGHYPLLKNIHLDGGLGHIIAEVTGSFPILDEIQIDSNAASLEMNLDANWEKNCMIHLTSTCGEMRLNLPKNIGVVVYSKTGLARFHKGPLQKKGWLKGKYYYNDLYEVSPITLQIHIESKEGHITLN